MAELFIRKVPEIKSGTDIIGYVRTQEKEKGKQNDDEKKI